MKMIRNQHIKNFLEERGIYPIREYLDGAAFYKRTKEFYEALDQYHIEFYCIPNRL